MKTPYTRGNIKFGSSLKKTKVPVARSTNPHQQRISKKEFSAMTPRRHRDNITIIFVNTGLECINGHLSIHVREKENNTKMQCLYACNHRDVSLHSHVLSSLFKNRCKSKKTSVVINEIWLPLVTRLCSCFFRISSTPLSPSSSPILSPSSILPPLCCLSTISRQMQETESRIILTIQRAVTSRQEKVTSLSILVIDSSYSEVRKSTVRPPFPLFFLFHSLFPTSLTRIIILRQRSSFFSSIHHSYFLSLSYILYSSTHICLLTIFSPNRFRLVFLTRKPSHPSSIHNLS